jgi:hypothetical protein
MKEAKGSQLIKKNRELGEESALAQPKDENTEEHQEQDQKIAKTLQAITLLLLVLH